MELKSGWYKHLNNEFPNWRAFLNIKENSYFGFNVTGGKMEKDNSDIVEMYDYIEKHKLIMCDENESEFLNKKYHGNN